MSVPVSSTLESPVTSETTLQKEQHLFDELFRRLVDALINRVFDLRPERASQRLQYLVFLFFLSIFLITLTHENYALRFWAQHIQSIFLYLFNPAYAATYNGNPIVDFFNFAVRAFTDPHTLQYIPILLASFFIALEAAAIYLADIFELEEVGIGVGVSVARNFIQEVALTGTDATIRIQHGEISEEHRHSPNYLIGGPGKVIVDLDSVALFEKPDGTPHVIGPTGKQPRGRATLEGFERFRQAIDIRDHYVDLRDQDPKSQAVKSRSLDGMPITATDVRLMFSVYRGENPQKADQFPYPFSRDAIEQIVYKASSKVTPDQPNPSNYEFSWINNMIGLIRGKLGGFMSQQKLSDYLASIGMPEFEKTKQSEELIAEQVQRLTRQIETTKDTELKPPPAFTPRHKITNLFSKFAEEFTKSARNNGVELHWIGVGTWKTPVELVPEKHLEAWKLSQDNIKNGSDPVMKMAEKEAMLQKMEALIRSVPLETFEEINGSGRQSKKPYKKDHNKKEHVKGTDGTSTEDSLTEDGMEDVFSQIVFLRELQNRRSYSSGHAEVDHKDAMKLLLLEYRKQLMEAVQFMKDKNEKVSPKIEEAIRHIDEQLGHWIGR